MKCSLLKEENYNISKWTGGKTKELAIFPRASKYLDRDFIWRLSSATVELEESDFSKLPDYNRVIMVLEGSVVLTYDGKKTVRLKELEQDSFDGASRTKSFGKITDFNLMVRKGGDGIVDIIRPEGEAAEFGDTLNSERNCTTHALYCKEGYFVVNAGEEQKMVNPGELFIMEFGGEEPKYTLMGEGIIIRSQIGYDYDGPEEAFDEPVPIGNTEDNTAKKFNFAEAGEPVKGSFAEDFKWSFVIANTQFRGAKYVFKKLKRFMYDDILNDRIKVLEKFFVTMIVFLVGLLVLMSIFVKKEAPESDLLILTAVWLVVDCLVVSPLVYYLALPKPIASHISDIEELTPEELKIIMDQRGKNERLEKLLKKYKNSGRAASFGIDPSQEDD